MPVVFALSDAAASTITLIAVWFVLFPLLVNVLIGIAVVGGMGEKAQNEKDRRYRK